MQALRTILLGHPFVTVSYSPWFVGSSVVITTRKTPHTNSFPNDLVAVPCVKPRVVVVDGVWWVEPICRLNL